MSSHYLDFSSCGIVAGFCKSGHIYTWESQDAVIESEKDDGRLDVSLTVCYQLTVTIGHQMVEASEILRNCCCYVIR